MNSVTSQYDQYVSYYENKYGNGDGTFTPDEAVRMFEAERPGISPNDSRYNYVHAWPDSGVHEIFTWFVWSKYLQHHHGDWDLGLKMDKLRDLVSNDLHIDTSEDEVQRLMDSYESDGRIVEGSLERFFQSWYFGDYEIAGEFNFPSGEPVDPNGPTDPEDPLDPEEPVDPNEPVEPVMDWPHGCEIGQAIETNLNSGFGKNGGLVDITELVTRLADRTGQNTIKLLERYDSDYEWWNDYDFIVRYIVGSFVNRYEDLNADSLKSILEFVGVGPIDQEVLEQVVEQYSEDGTHHFTQVEQMALVQDWFTCKLQFTEIMSQKNAFERLEEIALQLRQEIDDLKDSFLN